MMDFPLHDESTLSALHELFASATHDASAAMCRWTGGLITVTLDQVRQIPLEAVTAELEIGEEPLTMVVLTLKGPVGGNLILAFDELHGRQLAASLLGRSVGTDRAWSELEQSALTETGNILGCAYVNALTRLIGTDLVPSPPYFIQDFGASVLQQAILAQALTSDSLLLCQIGFHRQDQQLDWRMVFVPTQAMQAALQRSLQTTC
ncbi:MAG: chemotaxis protein [Pirellulaceae bacterium]